MECSLFPEIGFLFSATGYDLNSHESDVKFRMSFPEY